MVLISPSILGTKDEMIVPVCNELLNKGADYIHFDVMDGVFVENKSFSPAILNEIRKNITEAFLDVHLMIVDVRNHVDEYINAGANLITFHYEAVKEEEIVPLIDYIHSKNVKVGMSINPSTNAEVLAPFIDKLDLVLVMSVVPGKGGQSFMESALDKIRYYKELKSNNSKLLIEVDGGINEKTGSQCKASGVDVLVAGSYILKSDNYQARIESLR